MPQVNGPFSPLHVLGCEKGQGARHGRDKGQGLGMGEIRGRGEIDCAC